MDRGDKFRNVEYPSHIETDKRPAKKYFKNRQIWHYPKRPTIGRFGEGLVVWPRCVSPVTQARPTSNRTEKLTLLHMSNTPIGLWSNGSESIWSRFWVWLRYDILATLKRPKENRQQIKPCRSMIKHNNVIKRMAQSRSDWGRLGDDVGRFEEVLDCLRYDILVTQISTTLDRQKKELNITLPLLPPSHRPTDSKQTRNRLISCRCG